MPRVSELPASTALDQDDVLVAVEDGATVKVPVSALRAALGIELLATAEDLNETTYTANSTWDDLRGTDVTFDAVEGATYVYAVYAHWRPATTNWNIHNVRCVVDGATTGVSPTSAYATNEDSNASVSNAQSFFMIFFIEGLSAGSHTAEIQTSDGGSSLDRKFMATTYWLMRVA